MAPSITTIISLSGGGKILVAYSGQPLPGFDLSTNSGSQYSQSKHGLMVAGSCKLSQNAITPTSGMKKIPIIPQQTKAIAMEVKITVERYTSGIIPIEPLTRFSDRATSLLARFFENSPKNSIAESLPCS